MKNQKMILVPEVWFKSLLELATNFEEANKEWDYHRSVLNNNIMLKSVNLMGYAKSAASILKDNKRIDNTSE